MEAGKSLAGLKKTAADNLTIGMYVAQLDRPWEETDYPVQGFYLRSRQGIERVARECAFVYVDPRRYDSSLTDVKLHVVSAKAREQQDDSASKRSNVASIQPRKPREYKDTVELGNELEPARTSLEDAIEITIDTHSHAAVGRGARVGDLLPGGEAQGAQRRLGGEPGAHR